MIQVQGHLDERYRKALRRLTHGDEYTKEFLLSDATGSYWRVFTEYCGDISGRYVGAVGLGRLYAPEVGPAVDAVVEELLKAQQEDGHFNLDIPHDETNYMLIYGHGRMLQGLVEYFSSVECGVQSAETGKRREGVLLAIRRLADYYVTTAPAYAREEEQAKEEFMYYIQSLEGVVGAYRLTRDPRYLELAQSMASMVWEEPKHHSHSYISSLLGVLALYEATKEDRYLEFVQAKRELLTEMVTVDGGVTEQLPDKWCTEFCSVADWFMLNLRLGMATGQIDYLDEAEKILYNALYFNQFASGGFGTWHVNKEHGYPGRVEMGSGEAYWCCCFHGVRGLYDAIANAVTRSADAVSVNLPVAGSFGAIRIETDYPVSGQVRITVLEDTPSLRVRIPGWGGNAFFNGEKVLGGEWATANDLRAGDEVSLTFDLALRVYRENTLAWGPVLLAIDELYNATGPTDTEKPWSSPDEITVPESLGLLRATGLAVAPQWPELCFRAGSTVLTPLARSLPNNPVCAPSTRLRYQIRY